MSFSGESDHWEKPPGPPKKKWGQPFAHLHEPIKKQFSSFGASDRSLRPSSGWGQLPLASRTFAAARLLGPGLRVPGRHDGDEDQGGVQPEASQTDEAVQRLLGRQMKRLMAM